MCAVDIMVTHREESQRSRHLANTLFQEHEVQLVPPAVCSLRATGDREQRVAPGSREWPTTKDYVGQCPVEPQQALIQDEPQEGTSREVACNTRGSSPATSAAADGPPGTLARAQDADGPVVTLTYSLWLRMQVAQ